MKAFRKQQRMYKLWTDEEIKQLGKALVEKGLADSPKRVLDNKRETGKSGNIIQRG